MGFFTDDDRRHRETLRAARQELDTVTTRDNAANVRGESDAFLAANEAVVAAEQPLPWWKRADIDADLYHRTPEDNADTDGM